MNALTARLLPDALGATHGRAAAHLACLKRRLTARGYGVTGVVIEYGKKALREHRNAV